MVVKRIIRTVLFTYAYHVHYSIVKSYIGSNLVEMSNSRYMTYNGNYDDTHTSLFAHFNVRVSICFVRFVRKSITVSTCPSKFAS